MSKDLKQTQRGLIDEVQKRTELIVNDIRSFSYSKIKKANDSRSYINKIGGGNFLCALGIFSVLNLLAKINSILNGKRYENKNKKWGIYDDDGKKIVSEKECFVELYSDTTSLIKWGLKNKKDARDFWDNYRNSLSHVTVPKDGVAAYDEKELKDEDFDVFINKLKQDNRNIYGLNGINSIRQECLAIAVELFNEKLLDICDFVKDKINKCDNKNILVNIENLLNG